jgi:hypothetical protein
VLPPSGPNTWTATLVAPERGWTAAFIELTFAGAGRFPLTFTTEVIVTPDRLPYPPPPRSQGTP